MLQEPTIKSSFMGRPLRDVAFRMHERSTFASHKDAILKKLELEAKVSPDHVGKWELNDRNTDQALGKVI